MTAPRTPDSAMTITTDDRVILIGSRVRHPAYGEGEIVGTSRDALGLPGVRVRFSVRGVEKILPCQPRDLTLVPPTAPTSGPRLRVVDGPEAA